MEKNLPDMVLSKMTRSFENHDLKELDLYVTGYPELINYMGENQYNILHMCVKNNRHSWVRFLLDRGADPMIGDFEGNFPIGHAILNDDIKMVKLLIEYKANPYIYHSTKIPNETLYLTISTDNMELTEFFITHKAKINHFKETIDSISSFEMYALLKQNREIFNQDGLDYWEHQKLLLLVKEPKTHDRYEAKKLMKRLRMEQKKQRN